MRPKRGPKWGQNGRKMGQNEARVDPKLDPKIGASWDLWKSERCKTPTYSLHISQSKSVLSYGFKIKRGLNGPPPGARWGPDSHISRNFVKFGDFGGIW